MNSDTINNQVDAAISTDMVIARLFDLVESLVPLSDEHKRAASYSACQCLYCAAIKRYVRAKIRVHRIERDPNPSDSYFRWAGHELEDAIQIKERAKIVANETHFGISLLTTARQSITVCAQSS